MGFKVLLRPVLHQTLTMPSLEAVANNLLFQLHDTPHMMRA